MSERFAAAGVSVRVRRTFLYCGLAAVLAILTPVGSPPALPLIRPERPEWRSLGRRGVIAGRVIAWEPGSDGRVAGFGIAAGNADYWLPLDPRTPLVVHAPDGRVELPPERAAGWLGEHPEPLHAIAGVRNGRAVDVIVRPVSDE